MTSTMRKRRGLNLTNAAKIFSRKQQTIRRETFITAPSSQVPQMEEDKEDETDLATPARLNSAHEAQLLQTNGKLPMWFRKLQGQGGASSAVQSEGQPRQVRSRWVEQLNPLTICSNFSPSPTKSQEEEEEQREEEDEEEEGEGDFHPQSLESLLEGEEEEEEEKEVLQNPGDNRNSYILYPNTSTTLDREFDVEGVTEPQPSVSQLEVKGQRVEPVWSTQLSPDSACSEGSAGSLEQQQDADTDSLSQGSSVGSLVLEDDEDRNSLKNHFDTLASNLTEEKFDTDLRTLQPPEEKHYLNPRLSISSRFLSRFQDRIRAWPSRAPPPISIPTRISEESNVSNTSVNLESSFEVTSTESTQRENKNDDVRRSQSALRRRASCMISQQPPRRPMRRRHTVVVVQCRDVLRDVTSRTLVPNSGVAVQQGAPRLSYLGTTASSRAKLSQDVPASSPDEEKENLCSSSDLQPPAPLPSAGLDRDSTKPDPSQDQTSSITLSSHHHVPAASLRCSVGSVEETLTNQNQTLSPAPSITPTATPPVCDIITSGIISCSASRQEEDLGGSETRIRTHPVSDASLGVESHSADPPTSTSSPLSEKPRPSQTGDDEESVSLQQCQQVANELRQTARRAVHLYQQLRVSVGGSERHLQMSSVLQGAFDVVHAELRAVLVGGEGQGSSAPCGGLKDEETMCLLEKYSELLLQMTQKKLNRI